MQSAQRPLGGWHVRVGDVLLELEATSEGDTFFVLGLGSFLLGHVAYVLACVRDGGSLQRASRRILLRAAFRCAIA